MTLSDTSGEAAEAYVAAFESLGGAARVARAVQMAEESKELALAGIRFRRPELSDVEVHAEWIRLLHGDVLAAAVLARAV